MNNFVLYYDQVSRKDIYLPLGGVFLWAARDYLLVILSFLLGKFHDHFPLAKACLGSF